MQYLDFEIEVSAGQRGGYTVKVLRSPAGEATSTMRMPFTGLALQNNLQALQIALLRSGATRRRVDTPEAQTVQKFGKELWGALFSGDILGRFEASRSEAKRQDAGMRIKLRFDAPELAALPWEYLFDDDRGDYVTLSASTPVVRYIPLPEAMAPLRVQPPLRILGMVVSPSDLPALDVDREKQRLEMALGDLTSRGVVELVWMPGGTSRDLQQILWKGPWHVFHFIGHGGFDEIRGEGLVIFQNATGKAQRVSATDLGRLLGDHDPLRLAVLNSCESARGDQLDVFSSTAATLVRRGTPAVVAMQYEITDEAAIEFSRSFYEAVASGIAVDASLAEARKGVALAIPGTLEWGTPVLYMRAPDGVLFDIPPVPDVVPPPPPPPPPPEPTPPEPEPLPPEPTPPEPEPPEPTPPPPPEPPPAVVATPVVATPIVSPPPPESPPFASEPSPPTSTTSATIPVAEPVPAAPVVAASTWQAPTQSTSHGGRRLMIGLIVVFGFLIVFFAALGALSSLDSGGGAGTLTPDPFDSNGGIFPGTSDEPAFPTDSVGGVIPGSVDTGILFSNGPAGDEEIYHVDPDGGAPVALTDDHPADDRWPSWSPDHARIAFTKVTDGDGDIWIMDANGGNMTQVTSGPDNDWAPNWSRDGHVLAFNSNRNESTRSLNDLWLVRLDVTDAEPTFLFGTLGFDDRSPAWSPTADMIAFSSERNGNGRALFLVDSSQTLQLTPDGAIDRNPSWRSDGVFALWSRATVESPTLSDIWQGSPLNGSVEQLTTDPAQEGNPVYSPDGARIAFYRLIDSDFHIFVRELTGGAERDLTESLAGDSRDPSWR